MYRSRALPHYIRSIQRMDNSESRSFVTYLIPPTFFSSTPVWSDDVPVRTDPNIPPPPARLRHISVSINLTCLILIFIKFLHLTQPKSLQGSDQMGRPVCAYKLVNQWQGPKPFHARLPSKQDPSPEPQSRKIYEEFLVYQILLLILSDFYHLYLVWLCQRLRDCVSW